MQSQQPKKNNTTLIVVVIAAVVVLAGAAWWYQMWMAQQTAKEVVNTLAGVVGGKVNVNVQQGDKKVTITGQDGSKTEIGVGSTVPSDFPSDVPVYPSATVKASGSGYGNVNSIVGSSVVLLTSDSTEKVATYYQAEMVKNGWTSMYSVDTDQGKLYMYTKSNRTSNVVVGTDKEAKQTFISLTATRK